MKRVLATIDTSPCAQAVLASAPSIAELFEATAAALHVRENGSEAARHDALEAGIALREAAGAPIEVIAAAAEDPDVVAIVLGACGERDGPQPAGHTALEVITRVTKPIVVVPPGCAPSASIARILTPLEGSSETSQAIADTIALANRRDVEIVVLHVHAPEAIPPFQDQPHHELPAWEREFAARFVTVPRARVQMIQRIGTAADRIVAAARDVDADLILLGWNQRLTPGRAQVVREALAQSTTPVLLVPTP